MFAGVFVFTSHGLYYIFIEGFPWRRKRRIR
jgi:hypothetical protein